MKIVIVGSGGRLGAALARALTGNFDITGFNHDALDLGNVGEIHACLERLKFDVLINAAGLTDVDLCEKEPDRAFRINTEAPQVLARMCRDQNARLIHFSTDYVFDGEKREPYTEEDLARPISIYGASKRAGEESILAVQDRHLIVRVSWVFGPERPSFIDGVIRRAMETEEIEAVSDKFSLPTYTKDIAGMLPRLFDANFPGGILHFCNSGECSWQSYAEHALDCCHQLGVKVKAKTVAPLKMSDMKNFVARRPVYSVLSTEKYKKLAGGAPRPWRDAVADYIKGHYSKT